MSTDEMWTFELVEERRSSTAPVAPANGFDALLPPSMLERAVTVGEAKSKLTLVRLGVLGLLGGAFIALGASFSTVVTSTGMAQPSEGATRLLGGLSFSLGLLLVVIGGAELFTGNALLTIACAERRVPVRRLLRNWTVVYVTNAIGAIAIAVLVFATGQYRGAGGAIGTRMLSIAETKTASGLGAVFVSGIVANMLVCLAVWMSYAGRSVADKAIAIAFPVAAFVAGGFEHSIANLYMLPTGWMVHRWAGASFWAKTATRATTFGHVRAGSIAGNILFATAGNVIGGGFLVGLVYWFVYGRSRSGGG